MRDPDLRLATHGGDRWSEKAKADQVRTTNLKRSSDARAYILAGLERDGFVELAGKVRAGSLSANAAAIDREISDLDRRRYWF